MTEIKGGDGSATNTNLKTTYKTSPNSLDWNLQLSNIPQLTFSALYATRGFRGRPGAQLEVLPQAANFTEPRRKPEPQTAPKFDGLDDGRKYSGLWCDTLLCSVGLKHALLVP